ncbi:MAG: gamma-glutamyl-gamma-aminobutyrate hydrolase family protein [Actinomycetota bacterium]|jgi:putative glutamine amidotransferase|nr:gamma-glutamyl-gamma-aminobutyrate hydrolase family protein [Actinomycetota bacterium]
MSRPVIGLPGRRKKGHQIQAWPEVLNDLDIDLYLVDYARAVLAAGGLPLHIPIDVDAAEVVGVLDGIVLTGGADLDPQLYGAESETDDFPPETERDVFEMQLIDAATQSATPVLGICRGLQLANVAAGGSLHQDIPPHAGFDRPPETELHDVVMVEGTIVHGLYGDRRAVNSLHHQTVDRVGADLTVSARSPDGTVEALEHDVLPMISVQWHPEMMTSAAEDPIFAWLVRAAADFSVK